MKTIMYKLLSVFLLVFVVSSCEFGDTNINPSEPVDVEMAAILPAAEAGITWAVGGELVRFSGLLTQQFNGINAQQQDNARYLIRESDTDGVWERLYHFSMNPLQVILEKAIETDAPHYSGVAKVMMVVGISNTTDAFGDVPFTSAFEAEDGNITPTFDGQEALYGILQQLLDDAIVELQAESSPGGSPGNDDLIHGGDLSKWVKAAFSLKARLFIHTSKVNGTAAYNNALDALANGMTTNEDNLELEFGSSPNEPNPQFQFVQDRGGNMEIGGFFFDLLNEQEDPRRDALLDMDGDEFTREFNTGTFYTIINSPGILMSYAEHKFIEAEAKLMTGDVAGAELAFQEAVSASVTDITGEENTQFVTEVATFDGLTTDQERLEAIITQKYIATYSQGIETWVDFRRTGFPELTPVEQGTNAFNANGQIPRRLPYPQDERLLNPNIPFTVPDLQQRFWWDQ